MRRLLTTLALAALACTAAAQQQQHLVGEITSIDQSNGRVNVKTDAGAVVVITTDERTVYRRLPPGETSLQKAERITRADLRTGDRVLVPGAATQSATQAASQLIVTSRAASASPQDEARRRGVAGRVVALDAARRQIVIETRGRDASARAVTIDAASQDVRFLRYAPDSFRRADARPGSFTDIAIGDALRAFGERIDDGSRVTAAEVISGTVERIVGTVSSVDTSRGEVVVKNEQTGQTVVINVGKNTTLRRVPRETAEELAARAEQREERRDAQQQRARPAGRTIQQIFESLPVINVSDLKKGDTAVVTATVGEDASRATAVSLIAGEASMLRWLQRFQRVADEPREMSPGLPGNVLGGNTGTNDEP